MFQTALLFSQPLPLSANQIDEAGAEDICQGMNQEKRQQVFDFVFVEEVVHQAENDADNGCPKHALVSMEGDAHQGRIGQCLPFVFVFHAGQKAEETEFLIKAV